jgi:hypothetical protein
MSASRRFHNWNEVGCTRSCLACRTGRVVPIWSARLIPLPSRARWGKGGACKRPNCWVLRFRVSGSGRYVSARSAVVASIDALPACDAGAIAEYLGARRFYSTSFLYTGARAEMVRYSSLERGFCAWLPSRDHSPILHAK